jgi:hypothetical protein
VTKVIGCHQTIFKAIDPSLKIDVGGIIQGVLLDVQRKFKSLLYRHNRLFYSNNFRLNKCYYFRVEVLVLEPPFA